MYGEAAYAHTQIFFLIKVADILAMEQINFQTASLIYDLIEEIFFFSFNDKFGEFEVV